MPKGKIITAIDVGSTKVSTIIASVDDNKVSVIGVSGAVLSRGVNKGNVVDIDDTVESISHSLERAERMAGVSVSAAFVTVSGSHIRTQNSHGVVAVSGQNTDITAEDVYRVTEAAQAISLPSTEEVIHVLPRGFIVDSQDGVRDPVGMSGIRLEVETNIIYGSATSMRNLAKCVEQVGVEVSDMVFTGLASSMAVLTDTEKELGTLLIDIGGGTTSIIAYTEGSPSYSAVLPIGARHITHDLAIGLRTRLDEAEKIKLKLSNAGNTFMTIDHRNNDDEMLDVSEFGLEEERIPKKFLNEVIDARLNEIFRLVALEVEKGNLTGKLPAGAIITGGGSLTAGVERVAKRALKTPVRIGRPGGVTGLIDEINGPSFSASVGSVLYGMEAFRTGGDLSFGSGKGNIVDTFSSIFKKLKSFLP
jgi:cell division protein FtsA